MMKDGAQAAIASKNIRAFFALDISEEIRAGLDRISDRLRRAEPRMKTVRPENLHVSLVFLGDVTPDQVADLRVAMDAIGADFAPFSLTLDGLGVFGNPRSPRVLWAGVSCPDMLLRLYRETADAASMCGVQTDSRPYRPHITLSRFPRRGNFSRLAQRVEAESPGVAGRFDVRRLILFRSVLTPQGARYSLVHEALFTAG